MAAAVPQSSWDLIMLLVIYVRVFNFLGSNHTLTCVVSRQVNGQLRILLIIEDQKMTGQNVGSSVLYMPTESFCSLIFWKIC